MNFLRNIPIPIIFIPLYIAILLCAECGLRKLNPDLAANNVVPDPLFHHAYKPNITFTTFPKKNDGFPPAKNVINSMGMRGPLPKEKEHTRVLLLGDSFVQADEVNFEDTFGQLLNQHFQNRMEFVSHGMVSWSPTPEFSWLHHQGFSLQPDHIVLFLCINDFFGPDIFHQTDAVYREQAIYKNGIPVAYDLPEPTWSKTLLMHSAIARLTHQLYYKFQQTFKGADSDAPFNIATETIILSLKKTHWSDKTLKNVTETLDVVRSIKKASIRFGITLHVTLVPLPFFWPDEAVTGKALPPYNWPSNFTVSQNGIEEYIRGYIDNLGVNWIDLQYSFTKAKTESIIKLYNEVDGHWNTNGHQVVYQSLVDYFDFYNK